MSSPKTPAIPIVPLRIGSEPETGYTPLLPQSIGPDLQASAGSLLRLIPKAPPVKYPPPPPFEGAKMPLKKVGEAVSTTLNPIAIEYLRRRAEEAKDDIEFKANENMRKITYPEPLINEALNRFLSRF